MSLVGAPRAAYVVRVLEVGGWIDVAQFSQAKAAHRYARWIFGQGRKLRWQREWLKPLKCRAARAGDWPCSRELLQPAG